MAGCSQFDAKNVWEKISKEEKTVLIEKGSSFERVKVMKNLNKKWIEIDQPTRLELSSRMMKIGFCENEFTKCGIKKS